jgi:hypothetical protein
MEYKAELEKIDPEVEYLMTLYLHENMLEEIDVEGQEGKVLRGVHEIRKASKAGVKGVFRSHPGERCRSLMPGVVVRNQVLPPRSHHPFVERDRVLRALLHRLQGVGGGRHGS